MSVHFHSATAGADVVELELEIDGKVRRFALDRKIADDLGRWLIWGSRHAGVVELTRAPRRRRARARKEAPEAALLPYELLP